MRSKYHVFIAYAGPDRELAKTLFAELAPRWRVFLDCETLPAGVAWDAELPMAQRDSLATLVLLTGNTPQAWYQREEIQAAIARARLPGNVHTVIPLICGDLVDVPYGLSRLVAIRWTSTSSLTEVVASLQRVIDQAVNFNGIPLPTEAPPDKSKYTTPGLFADLPGFLKRLLQFVSIEFRESSTRSLAAREAVASYVHALDRSLCAMSARFRIGENPVRECAELEMYILGKNEYLKGHLTEYEELELQHIMDAARAWPGLLERTIRDKRFDSDRELWLLEVESLAGRLAGLADLIRFQVVANNSAST